MPTGDVIKPETQPATMGATYYKGNNVPFYRLILSLPQGTGQGKWTAVLTVNDKYWKRYLTSIEESPACCNSLSVHGLLYSLTVQAYSSLRFKAALSQNSYEPGATITLRAVLTENSLPFETGPKWKQK